MSDDPIRRARSELERAVQETTSDVEHRVGELDNRLAQLQIADVDEADRDARMESIADDVAILKEQTDGQTYTKLKHAEHILRDRPDAT